MYGGGQNQLGGMGGYGNAGGYENVYGGNTSGDGNNRNIGWGTGSNTGGYMGNASGGNGGMGGRQPLTCYTCGKPGHYSRECWMKRGRQEDNELEEIRQQDRAMMQERREAEERRRVEQRRLHKENERRREQDMIRRAEEIRLQLEAGLEEKWQQQTKQAVGAAAAAKAKPEEARARAEEAHAKAEEARAKGFEEPWDEVNHCQGSQQARGLRFDMPGGNGVTGEDEPKIPMDNGHKGLAVKCSREGLIDYYLSTQKILSAKKATMLRKIQWLAKYLARSEIKTDMMDLKRAGVYIVASPWSKKVYVGSTIRSIMQRWREHLSNTDTEVIGSSPKLYRWMRHYGSDNFVIIPVRHASEEDDRAFERHLIRDFSPSLNTCNSNGQGGSKTRSRRKGKRERKRMRAGQRERVKSVVSFTEGNENERRVSLLTWLEGEWKKNSKGERRVVFQGGETWSDGWRKIKRLFGMTKVRISGRIKKLATSKAELQRGVTVVFIGITKTTTTTTAYMQELRWMLKKPFLFKRLVDRNTSQLVGMYRSAGLFRDKKTKNYLSLKIDKAVKKKTGVRIRKRVQVKVMYDRQIVKKKVRQATEGVVEGKVKDVAVANLIKGRIRITWKRNKTVGEILHNHRRHAHVGVQLCTCRTIGLPTTDGHVLTRFSELGDVPEFMKNGRNGLVLAPVDRNQGDTAVICPVIYRHAFGKAFVWNGDYEEKREKEQDILRKARVDYEQANLDKSAAWKTEGRVGRAYVIPKDKDLSKWRPIAPATGDPAGAAQRKVVRALHYLMKLFPKEQTFYLNSI
ncbi:hypothetical protein CBR_g48684 [Chara braunii]|uniref:CCHC-type domain-containing protein n=1 Tax=Chara braunii TaxID=69332 RepID=A0A388K4J3_CHABU|nr:hypothetical protein CBR_g48684 [Chara braunii]|eukprot:GBG64936.1 hypothetical protein CBR_g48684 [Chara braunii]